MHLSFSFSCWGIHLFSWIMFLNVLDAFTKLIWAHSLLLYSCIHRYVPKWEILENWRNNLFGNFVSRRNKAQPRGINMGKECFELKYFSLIISKSFLCRGGTRRLRSIDACVLIPARATINQGTLEGHFPGLPLSVLNCKKKGVAPNNLSVSIQHWHTLPWIWT